MKSTARQGREDRLELLARPFAEFASTESSGGILLLFCTAVALVWANSAWADQYNALWHAHLGLALGSRTFGGTLHFFVNDALMTVFFFVVGLEIKRELLAGELASPRKAALPIAAALGGVVVPAMIYLMLNAGGAGERGWGIPMATDIAFAIGVLALLGDRVPVGLKVFLTALAIVDDIVAVLVIAVFYTEAVSMGALGVAAVSLLVLAGANRAGVRHPAFYAAVGVVLWVAVLESGVHATIAGVLLALTIPSRREMNVREFVNSGRMLLAEMEKAGAGSLAEQQAAVESLEAACEKVQTPLHRLEGALHPWVTFVIMPLFALANAGVRLDGGMEWGHPILLGVWMGLLLGKPAGIVLASFVAVKIGMAALPEGVRWGHIHGAGWLGGIGFTMSLFVASLGLPEGPFLGLAKAGILGASTCAGMMGAMLLRMEAKRAAS